MESIKEFANTKNTLKGRKILIIHFRVGNTDGVSIEIAEWEHILKENGAIVKLCAGPISHGASFVIDNLEQQLNQDIFDIDRGAFGEVNIFKNKQSFIKAIRKQQKILKTELEKVLIKFKPDNIIISNIFSTGQNLPAAEAVTLLLDKWQIPTSAIHHDFYWERPNYSHPRYPFVENQLKEFFPPKRSWLKHYCINSISQKELKKRKGVSSGIIYDTLHFEQPAWEKDEFSKDLLDDFDVDKNDIVILQATRVVERKNIEIAIDLVKNISEKRWLSKLANKKLYDGRRFDPGANKAVLVLAGSTNRGSREYLQSLLSYARKRKVKICHVSNKMGKFRIEKNGQKKYSLWDIYPFADIILYPTRHEGFGNQFLEACFAKKPVVIFEYPVFKSDIKPKGFKVISLGDKLLLDDSYWAKLPQAIAQKATGEIVDILTNSKKYSQLVEKNFKLAKRHFSHQKTLSTLIELLSP